MDIRDFSRGAIPEEPYQPAVPPPDQLPDKIDYLEGKSDFSKDEIDLIFLLKETFDKLTSSGEKVPPLFQRIQPLYEKAKLSIKQYSQHESANVAANKGKALLVASRGMRTITEQGLLEKGIKSNSTQRVLLFSDQDLVMKVPTPRAREEENNVNDILALLRGDSDSPSMVIKPSHFGLNLNPHNLFQIDKDNISDNAYTKIKERLNPRDRQRVRRLDDNKECYEQLTQKQWWLKAEGKDPVRVSFAQLKALDFVENPHQYLIGDDPNSLQPYSDHMVQGSDLYQLLHYTPILPTFELDLDEKKFTKYNNNSWQYTKNGIVHEVSFRELVLEYVEDPSAITFIKFKEPKAKSFTILLPQDALNVPFKLSQEIAVNAKPFVHNLRIFEGMSEEAKTYVLGHLDSDAEFDSVSTALVQLLDLHSTNLGFAPIETQDVQKFKELNFTVDGIQFNFDQLLSKQINKTLDLNSTIEFRDQNSDLKQGKIKDFPDLLKALDGPWCLVLFDTDMSLAEDNIVLRERINGQVRHLIPFRSAFLESQWKDKPFKQETIDKLHESFAKYPAIRKWAKNDDSPIRMRLKDETRQLVDQSLEPLLMQSNLGPAREQRILKEDTFAEIKTNLVIQLNDPTFDPMWKRVEDDLNRQGYSSAIYPGDTFELISLETGISVDRLKELNPDLVIDYQKQQSIKLEYRLMDNTPHAQEMREYIAKQLLPRLTYNQQTALVERQEGLKSYLNGWDALSQSTLTNEALCTELQTYLNQPQTPLNILQRNHYLDKLAKAVGSSNYSEVESLKNEIIEKCRPTFFNVTKALYPLLADEFALLEQMQLKGLSLGKVENPGFHIGLYYSPIEEFIRNLDSRKLITGDIKILVDAIEIKYKNKPLKAYSGSWIY